VNGNATFVLAILNGTAFYVLGTCLAVLAIVVTAIGLRSSDAFSSRAAVRGGLVIFAVLVIGTVIFAVRYSRDEQTDRRAELAAEEKKEGATPIGGGTEVPSPDAAELGGATGPSKAPESSAPKAGSGAAKGPGGTLKIAADPTQLAYDEKTLQSKPGKVTIDFDNPAQLQHDVVIAQGSKVLAQTDLIAQSKTSTSADLAPGSYDFYCDVPGHREAGMEGTLTVK
jgi:plastocyanin